MQCRDKFIYPYPPTPAKKKKKNLWRNKKIIWVLLGPLSFLRLGWIDKALLTYLFSMFLIACLLAMTSQKDLIDLSRFLFSTLSVSLVSQSYWISPCLHRICPIRPAIREDDKDSLIICFPVNLERILFLSLSNNLSQIRRLLPLLYFLLFEVNNPSSPQPWFLGCLVWLVSRLLERTFLRKTLDKR